MKALEGIRKRARAYEQHGTPGLAAPRDRKVLLAALDAVMDLADQCDDHGISPHMIHAAVDEAIGPWDLEEAS